MHDVIVINREDAVKMMELTIFSAMVVSNLFEDQRLKWEGKE